MTKYNDIDMGQNSIRISLYEQIPGKRLLLKAILIKNFGDTKGKANQKVK